MDSFFSNLKNNIVTTVIDNVAKVKPTLKDSKFLKEGVLTSEEFIQAGDFLVTKCGTWAWERGEASKAFSYLPLDKQFLITRNVPCHARVKSLEATKSEYDAVKIDGDDGADWVSYKDAEEGEAIGEIPDNSKKVEVTQVDDDDDDDDGVAYDMETFEDSNNVLQEDDAALKIAEDNILKTRTYDISITYDNYYQTPRLWLFGYDENRKPLKPEQIFQDISEDHAKKTVTLDTHPHLQIPCVYIHPCKHAEVMKKIVQRLVDDGREPRIDHYLLIFLKFISAVIPTIEHDYTLQMDL